MVMPCMEKQHATGCFKLMSASSCGITQYIAMCTRPCCRCVVLKLNSVVIVCTGNACLKYMIARTFTLELMSSCHWLV